MIDNKLFQYRFLIVLSIIILIFGYLFNEIIVLYLFAIGYLIGHAINNWNRKKIKRRRGSLILIKFNRNIRCVDCRNAFGLFVFSENMIVKISICNYRSFCCK